MAIDLLKIQESPNLLDILVQMEDVLDSLDIYVFSNWLDGEVVDGPTIKRYWLSFTLRYPADKKPDPAAALRLMKHGVRINIEKASVESDKIGSAPMKDDDKGEHVWLVDVSMPRRLVVQMAAAELDFYDEEVDVTNVEDAQDDGLDDESRFSSDDQNAANEAQADPDLADTDVPPSPGGPQ